MSEDAPLEVAAGAKFAKEIRKSGFHQSQQLLSSEKSSGNVEHGTGSLVSGEGSVAHQRGGRRLHELVRADGSRKRAAGKRAPVGPDPLPQELDPGALR